MNFKGTKGIWSTEEGFDKNYDQPVININSSIGVEGICTVWSGSDRILKDTKANALLISKAPEMLETLQHVVDTLEAGDLPNVEEIKELIKQATEI